MASTTTKTSNSQKSQNPKTPARARPPLTPSLTASFNALSLGERHADGRNVVDNPFLSRPSSPVKQATSGFVVTAELQRQANGGIVRRGGFESRMDIVRHDYFPSTQGNRTPKRSKSMGRLGSEDRFLPRTRGLDDSDVAAAPMKPYHPDGSPRHVARLAEATGIAMNERILKYHEPPPLPSADKDLVQQRIHARALYQRPGAIASSTSVTTNKTRRIPSQPERVLDAPGMVDDFYLNLLSWSSTNVVAVALSEKTYLWRADTGSVTQVAQAPEGSYVSSVSFSNDGMFLAIGTGTGEVELWDVESGAKLRTMGGHQGQIACLSWNGHILSSGCGDGSIWHHDVRIARHKVCELIGHVGEVCGLEWRSDGEYLASGGNDNVVNVWDARMGDSGGERNEDPIMTKRTHTAAVKGLSWCPWQPSLLATGGGTSDATVHVWNITTGARIHSVQTPSQITSVQFAPHKKEIFTTHGYPTNSLMIHAYPSMERVAEIRDAHDSRVLFSQMSPHGDVVCTGAGDENLKFWRLWEVPKKKKEKSTKTLIGESILQLR
ncbi:WD repeat-containing protein slp1 [Hysterangium stoloniferum]|nr:WD repeat-containing protein slp1 [Hysterangium stoloniferum]